MNPRVEASDATEISIIPGHRASYSIPPFLFVDLEDITKHTAGDIGDVARNAKAASSSAEIVGVDAAGVVLTEGRVDGRLSPLVAPVLQVLFEVLGTTVDHGRGIRL